MAESGVAGLPRDYEEGTCLLRKPKEHLGLPKSLWFSKKAYNDFGWGALAAPQIRSSGPD